MKEVTINITKARISRLLWPITWVYRTYKRWTTRNWVQWFHNNGDEIFVIGLVAAIIFGVFVFVSLILGDWLSCSIFIVVAWLSGYIAAEGKAGAINW